MVQGGYQFPYPIWYIESSSDFHENISAFFFDTTGMPGSRLREQNGWIRSSLRYSLLGADGMHLPAARRLNLRHDAWGPLWPSEGLRGVFSAAGKGCDAQIVGRTDRLRLISNG
jgi:hypothetical protein